MEPILQVQQMTPPHVEAVQLAKSSMEQVQQVTPLQVEAVAPASFPLIVSTWFLRVVVGGSFHALWYRFGGASGFCPDSTGFGFCSVGFWLGFVSGSGCFWPSLRFLSLVVMVSDCCALVRLMMRARLLGVVFCLCLCPGSGCVLLLLVFQ